VGYYDSKVRSLDNIFGGAPGIRPADLRGEIASLLVDHAVPKRRTLSLGGALVASAAVALMGFWLLG
jgi:hypothetical protein